MTTAIQPGTERVVRATVRAEKRFWASIYMPPCEDDCWLWTGNDNGIGYGKLYVKAQRVYAHRYAYELLVGPIPRTLQLDHLCRDPACVNPTHLEAVTAKENMQRWFRTDGHPNAIKTHCPRGHEYTGTDTYIQPKRGGRECRVCKQAQGAARRAS